MKRINLIMFSAFGFSLAIGVAVSTYFAGRFSTLVAMLASLAPMIVLQLVEPHLSRIKAQASRLVLSTGAPYTKELSDSTKVLVTLGEQRLATKLVAVVIAWDSIHVYGSGVLVGLTINIISKTTT